MLNLDQVHNIAVSRAATVAYKLVDKLQLEKENEQLAGASLFFWAFCEATGMHPSRLLEAVDRCARDADRKQVPEVRGLVNYIKGELLR